MYRPLFVLFLFCIACFAAASETREIFVNGRSLSSQEIVQLKTQHGVDIVAATLGEEQLDVIRRAYGIVIEGNRFWYDSISGVWGFEGLPPAGQIQPKLPFAGALDAQSSGGGSKVTVNGRILHPAEIVYLLAKFGYVLPGDYYLLPDGTYGLVGGPVLGRIGANNQRSSLSRRQKFGTVIGGDGFVGYMPPRSGSASRRVGVSCAPDGGCIYY